VFVNKISASILVALVCSACAGYRANGAVECDAAEVRPLASTATASTLAGEYQLSLRATSGSEAGSVTTGTLSLFLDSERRAERGADSVAMIGSSDVNLETVGAAHTGDLASRDAGRPGVLVLQQGSDVTLRMGSEANRRDVQRFDGAFTALYVDWMTREAFGGRWASGVQGPDVRGTFCAVRRTVRARTSSDEQGRARLEELVHW
jgi:hypothetical protein